MRFGGGKERPGRVTLRPNRILESLTSMEWVFLSIPLMQHDCSETRPMPGWRLHSLIWLHVTKSAREFRKILVLRQSGTGRQHNKAIPALRTILLRCTSPDMASRKIRFELCGCFSWQPKMET